MIVQLNLDQKKSLSGFFNNIAVAWFGATFISPALKSEIAVLTFLSYFANIIISLYISLYLLRKKR